MSANEIHRPVRLGIARIALAALALAAAGAMPGAALANEATPAHNEEVSVAHLERAFWACDYVATTQGVSATPIAACKLATEALKKQKFGGDFEAFLSWWRENKPSEHLRMDRLEKVDAIL
jgi:hypothetical protein